MFYWAAFSMGLLGSLHCAGMCAPIALSLPYPEQSAGGKLRSILLYNFGRLITYSLIGLVFGLMGKGLFLAGWQRGISIVMGVFLLLVSFSLLNPEKTLMANPAISRAYLWLKRQLGRYMQRTGPFSIFLVGLLNGILPCGLVYLAIIGATTAEHAWQGMFYMASFGLGTFPIMIAVVWSGQWIKPGIRRIFTRFYPVFVFALAVLLIWRGLLLEVPRSLELWEALGQPVFCH
ncbi:MAG: sulfite exporter TauE/SafE family protein [Saprospiraceae bacterium]|nr:sulfite exporter TauE/SafE family protein [Lewinella sp.]